MDNCNETSSRPETCERPAWPSRSSSISSSLSSRHETPSSRTWNKLWSSKKTSPGASTMSSSRRPSSATTNSSLDSRSTISSKRSGSSDLSPIYRLPEHPPDVSTPESKSPFASVSEATLALENLTTDNTMDQGSAAPSRRSINSGRMSIDTLARVSERPQSTMSSTTTSSKLSAKQKEAGLGLAEIEMYAKEYSGYWRASFTAHLHPAAAICGSLLLTARLPTTSQSAVANIPRTDSAIQKASQLCEAIEDIQSPDEVMDCVQEHGLGVAILAVKEALNEHGVPTVPEKTSWAMYQRIADAKVHPQKLGQLWGHIAKLLKKVPSETMVVIAFLLSIARRLQSRNLLIDGRSPAVFLLEKMFPRYVAEDMSRLLHRHFEDIPRDLPLILESVNYRFAGRRCNVLALVASKRGSGANGKGGVEELRASLDKQND